jgi:hypothetical protein
MGGVFDFNAMLGEAAEEEEEEAAEEVEVEEEANVHTAASDGGHSSSSSRNACCVILHSSSSSMDCAGWCGPQARSASVATKEQQLAHLHNAVDDAIDDVLPVQYQVRHEHWLRCQLHLLVHDDSCCEAASILPPPLVLSGKVCQ